MYGMGPSMYPSFVRIQVLRERIIHQSQMIIILSIGDKEAMTIVKVKFN
jgi:hypothetical protein